MPRGGRLARVAPGRRFALTVVVQELWRAPGYELRMTRQPKWTGGLDRCIRLGASESAAEQASDRWSPPRRVKSAKDGNHMHVTSGSVELRSLREDPEWELVASVYLRRGSPTHSLAWSIADLAPYWQLKRWDWTPGRLTALMVDELGASVESALVELLMRLEGITSALWDSP